MSRKPSLCVCATEPLCFHVQQRNEKADNANDKELGIKKLVNGMSKSDLERFALELYNEKEYQQHRLNKQARYTKQLEEEYSRALNGHSGSEVIMMTANERLEFERRNKNLEDMNSCLASQVRALESELFFAAEKMQCSQKISNVVPKKIEKVAARLEARKKVLEKSNADLLSEVELLKFELLSTREILCSSNETIKALENNNTELAHQIEVLKAKSKSVKEKSKLSQGITINDEDLTEALAQVSCNQENGVEELKSKLEPNNQRNQKSVAEQKKINVISDNVGLVERKSKPTGKANQSRRPPAKSKAAAVAIQSKKRNPDSGSETPLPNRQKPEHSTAMENVEELDNELIKQTLQPDAQPEPQVANKRGRKLSTTVPSKRQKVDSAAQPEPQVANKRGRKLSTTVPSKRQKVDSTAEAAINTKLDKRLSEVKAPKLVPEQKSESQTCSKPEPRQDNKRTRKVSTLASRKRQKSELTVEETSNKNSVKGLLKISEKEPNPQQDAQFDQEPEPPMKPETEKEEVSKWRRKVNTAALKVQTKRASNAHQNNMMLVTDCTKFTIAKLKDELMVHGFEADMKKMNKHLKKDYLELYEKLILKK